MIWLDAEYELTASDGEKRVIGVGEVVLAEDPTGKGHITKPLGQQSNGFLKRNARTCARSTAEMPTALTTQLTTFTWDILGRYLCNTFAEAVQSRPFDAVIVTYLLAGLLADTSDMVGPRAERCESFTLGSPRGGKVIVAILTQVPSVFELICPRTAQLIQLSPPAARPISRFYFGHNVGLSSL